MATETERARLRSDIGADSTSLPDATADALFVEAGEMYTEAGPIAAYTRVLAIRRLMANAARLTDYTQNESQEKQSQIFAQLKQLLAFWQGELDDAIAAASTVGAARFGGLRRKPKAVKEWPGGR